MPEIPQGLCSKCHEGFMNCKCEQFHPSIVKKVIDTKTNTVLQIVHVSLDPEGLVIFVV